MGVAVRSAVKSRTSWCVWNLFEHAVNWLTVLTLTANLGKLPYINNGVKTLRTQDTSDLRHFGTGAEMSVRHFDTEVSLV